jgi:hypothetical protein
VLGEPVEVDRHVSGRTHDRKDAFEHGVGHTPIRPYGEKEPGRYDE